MIVELTTVFGMGYKYHRKCTLRMTWRTSLFRCKLPSQRRCDHRQALLVLPEDGKGQARPAVRILVFRGALARSLGIVDDWAMMRSNWLWVIDSGCIYYELILVDHEYDWIYIIVNLDDPWIWFWGWLIQIGFFDGTSLGTLQGYRGRGQPPSQHIAEFGFFSLNWECQT